MGKWISSLVAGAVCLTLGGCGGQPAEGAFADPVQEIEAETGDQGLDIQEPDTASTESVEVPILRDSMRSTLGAFAGCAVTEYELNDPGVWDIVTTHFETVTIGNELKPDALAAYSVSKCPGTATDELNGEEIVVPKLDYSRANAILDKLLGWNEEHPDRTLKVRGHVLVWHSQTPEWFFHEDYDKNAPYVAPEVMDKRLEWYIRTVLTYYTGEDSKYKGLFYGWDVVNEAVSDATGSYRTDAEKPEEPLSDDRHGSNSSWWHIYQSNAYIINAFRYANKYAPAELELYYNDYNECQMNKRDGIIALLKSVKAEEGAPGEGTRIDAMGMQGHYSMDSPSTADIQGSIQSYAAVVGKVQLTELDIRASEDYDGSDEAKAAEYEKQRKRYNMIRYAVLSAGMNEGCEVSGITFWGTADQYSWLQQSANVGGGTDGTHPQCPLLFDENYEPKPCFYVFAGTDNK